MRDRSGGGAAIGGAAGLPAALIDDVERAGFYPALVNAALDVAIAGETVECYLIHPETTFDQVEVRRHITVLVLTPTRLVVAHADDHDPDAGISEPYASASTESIALHRVSQVILSHAVIRPEQHSASSAPRQLNLAIGWGANSRIDLVPASCTDPDCENDHGYTGTIDTDDISIRVSSDAEGEVAVRAAVDFARQLSAATTARR